MFVAEFYPFSLNIFLKQLLIAYFKLLLFVI
jgi:hypothetical protein